MTTITLENLGTVNKNCVSFKWTDKLGNEKRLDLYFSYKTCVAFEYDLEMFCSDNIWSVTTGKLLNELQPDKDLRLPNSAFVKKLDKIVKKHIKLK